MNWVCPVLVMGDVCLKNSKCYPVGNTPHNNWQTALACEFTHFAFAGMPNSEPQHALLQRLNYQMTMPVALQAANLKAMYACSSLQLSYHRTCPNLNYYIDSAKHTLSQVIQICTWQVVESCYANKHGLPLGLRPCTTNQRHFHSA